MFTATVWVSLFTTQFSIKGVHNVLPGFHVVYNPPPLLFRLLPDTRSHHIVETSLIPGL